MTPKSLLHPARLARRPVLSTQSDARLVDLVRAGYDPAFETIVDRYRRPLLRYAGRILSGERAEDVVQLALVNAYEAMRRDTRELDLRPWLYRIVHNAALNALRDRRPALAELSEQLDGVERPDQALERRQGLREVLGAVQALPERQREAILLRELEGRSYDEIATALGVTDGAVRQLLNRARTTLRAGATAVAPAGWLARIPWAASAEPLAARVGEALGAASVGALAAKVCATALVTGAVVGGAAVVPDGNSRSVSGGEARAAEGGADRDGAEAAGAASGHADGDSAANADSRGPGRGHDGRGAGDRSGPGRADDSGPGDRSGPGERSGPGGSGDDDTGDGGGSSGPGGSGEADDDVRDGSSGSGDGGGGSSGPDGSGGDGDGDWDGTSDSGGSGEEAESLTSDPALLQATVDSSGSGPSGSGSGSSGSDSSD